MKKIEFDIFADDAKVAKAELEDWLRNTMMLQANELAGVVAKDVSAHMEKRSHVVTGKLRAATRNVKNVSRTKCRWTIVIDPVDDRWSKGPVHYAEIEQSKGRDHDFTAGYETTARISVENNKRRIFS